MTALPDGLLGRVLAVVIAMFVLTQLYLWIASPVLAYYDETAQRLRQRVEMAQRYETLAKELPTLRIGEKRWQDLAGGEWLLAGSSDAVACAALQSQLKELVEDGGAKLTSAEILAPEAAGSFRRVGIRVVFSGDIKLVTSVLRGIEISRPILAAGDFDIHAVDSENRNGDALAVTLDVYGFRAA